MIRVLVTYYSGSGHTEEMAETVAEGARETGADVVFKDVAEVQVPELKDYHAIIVGSPTYYGLMSGEVKSLFDRSVKLHGQLKGKVGGAFTSSANLGGGNETAILSILQAMLIHGMIVQGTPMDDHYGPVAVNNPDERALQQCRGLGRRVAELAGRLDGERELSDR